MSIAGQYLYFSKPFEIFEVTAPSVMVVLSAAISELNCFEMPRPCRWARLAFICSSKVAKSKVKIRLLLFAAVKAPSLSLIPFDRSPPRLFPDNNNTAAAAVVVTTADDCDDDDVVVAISVIL